MSDWDAKPFDCLRLGNGGLEHMMIVLYTLWLGWFEVGHGDALDAYRVSLRAHGGLLGNRHQ